MATIRFGTTTSPCRTPCNDRPQQGEEEVNREDWDPEKLLPCPFDKNHQIRACRFPYHLIKCKKNHPELAKELKTCPFNARHLVTKKDLPHHIETCPDRTLVVEGAESPEWRRTWQVPVSTWVNPDMTEDWDNEADDDAPPFVWGANQNPNRVLEMKPTDNLSLRAPRTFPWSNHN